jgi:hypothetical protein
VLSSALIPDSIGISQAPPACNMYSSICRALCDSQGTLNSVSHSLFPLLPHSSLSPQTHSAVASYHLQCFNSTVLH